MKFSARAPAFCDTCAVLLYACAWDIRDCDLIADYIANESDLWSSRTLVTAIKTRSMKPKNGVENAQELVQKEPTQRDRAVRKQDN